MIKLLGLKSFSSSLVDVLVQHLETVMWVRFDGCSVWSIYIYSCNTINEKEFMNLKETKEVSERGKKREKWYNYIIITKK